MTSDKWITVNEMCKYLQVSNETIYSWIEKSDMPGHRIGKRWMFKQEEVDKWVRTGKAAAKDFSTSKKVKIKRKD